MIRIDGSLGEGGGQILRTALALSLATGQAFEVVNIRSNRPKPGLRPQHLEAVRIAARIAAAKVDGVLENSSTLRFEPRAVCAGRYRIEIRTAGSAPLVLQTVCLPLALANEESRVEIQGGTHVPWSPCYHYLERQWAPRITQLGFRVQPELKRAGFYPRGGGEMQGRIEPSTAFHALRCQTRGAMRRVSVLSVGCNLSSDVAERQAKEAQRRLDRRGLDPRVEIIDKFPASGKGSFVLLTAEFENGAACYSALGAPGKPSEKVAEEAVRQLLKYLDCEAAFDEYLGDQILLPLALIPDESEYTTACVTNHLVTNAQVIRHFLNVKIHIEGKLGQPGLVSVRGADVVTGRKGGCQ